MTRFTSVVLAGLFAFLVAEPVYAQQDSRRVGIGVAIGNVYDISPRSAAEMVTAPAILIPIQVTNGFRLEPEISVFRSSNETIGEGRDGETASFGASVNGVEVGLGVFPQMLQQDFRLYYGVRVGYVRIVEEGTFLGDEETRTLTGFFAAPAVGGEYLFSDRFSLGAEVQFRHTSVKDEDVERRVGLRGGSGPVIFLPGVRVERSVSATRVLFVSRFYF